MAIVYVVWHNRMNKLWNPNEIMKKRKFGNGGATKQISAVPM